jgi:hypothetical protein
MVFLAATNVLGYLVTNKLNAVIFFALVSLITYQFSKNMAVILLVAVIATNFLMSNKRMREGLENPDSPQALSKIEDKDKQIADVIPAVQNASNNDEVDAQLNSMDTSSSQISNIAIPTAIPTTVPTNPAVPPSNPKQTNNSLSSNTIIDSNNLDLNSSSTDTNAPEGFGAKLSNKKSGPNSGPLGPRLDYAATIEESYANLDNLLGSDSIKQLTNDTQKLMKQQQTLFNTMNQMVPVLEGAQNMLSNLNVGGIADTLKGLSTGLGVGSQKK